MVAIRSNSRRGAALLAGTAAIATVAAFLLATSQGAPASTAEASKAPTAKVDIRNFKFQPGVLEARKGTRVIFSNLSAIPHTATRGGGFDTGRIGPGRSAGVLFGQGGTFRYHCKIHPDMRGKIVVG